MRHFRIEPNHVHLSDTYLMKVTVEGHAVLIADANSAMKFDTIEEAQAVLNEVINKENYDIREYLE